MVPSKRVYLLFGCTEASSEWELSVPSADLPLHAGYAFTTGGIPGRSCFLLLEWCVKCVGSFACGCFSLSLLFFSRHSWVMVSGGERGGGSLGNEHARRPLPLLPSSLTSCGIKEEYGFNREGEVFFFSLLKRGRGWGEGLSWIARASMGRMPGC